MSATHKNQRPPAGAQMRVPHPEFDAADKETLTQLAKGGLCQARVIVDGGQHYVYCGAYYSGPAAKTPKGLRCAYHRD